MNINNLSHRAKMAFYASVEEYGQASDSRKMELKRMVEDNLKNAAKMEEWGGLDKDMVAAGKEFMSFIRLLNKSN
jgi:hypothetical protein